MKRKWLAAALVLWALLVMQTAVPAAEDATIVDSGTCGEGLTWILDSGNGLTISGEGAMRDVVRADYVPWYQYRTQIVRVTAQNGVTTIGNYAFTGCTALTELNFADSVRIIGNSAFQGCTALEELDLPAKTASIGTNAFDGCTALTRADLPVSLATLSQSAFLNCTGLEEAVIPANVTKLSAYVFQNCENLTKITLPAGLESIGTQAFQDCASLSEIVLPEKLESIGARAFKNCAALTGLAIPRSVEEIQSDAFDGCTGLQALYYAGSEKEWRRITDDALRARLEELGATVYYDGKTEADPAEPVVPSFTGEIASVAVSGAGIAAAVPEAEAGSVLVAAVYDPEGRMLDAVFYTLSEGETQIYLDINLQGASTIAAYLLDPSGKPAAEAVTSTAVG